jgi:hypothetical protein
MALFKRNFTKGQKVYIVAMAQYGTVQMKRGGLIKVKPYKSANEIWVHPHEIEDGR